MEHGKNQGLVCTEYPYCQQAIIVSYLFPLINIIQAFGRIRPHTRTSYLTLEMTLPSEIKSMGFYEGKDQSGKINLKTKGLLNDRVLISYDKLFTFKSLYDWINADTDCYFWSVAT